MLGPILLVFGTSEGGLSCDHTCLRLIVSGIKATTECIGSCDARLTGIPTFARLDSFRRKLLRSSRFGYSGHFVDKLSIYTHLLSSRCSRACQQSLTQADIVRALRSRREQTAMGSLEESRKAILKLKGHDLADRYVSLAQCCWPEIGS
jgi:hypothetical protein